VWHDSFTCTPCPQSPVTSNAVCCSVLQCVVVCCSNRPSSFFTHEHTHTHFHITKPLEGPHILILPHVKHCTSIKNQKQGALWHGSACMCVFVCEKFLVLIQWYNVLCVSILVFVGAFWHLLVPFHGGTTQIFFFFGLSAPHVYGAGNPKFLIWFTAP